jgi:hypothetical protein
MSTTFRTLSSHAASKTGQCHTWVICSSSLVQKKLVAMNFMKGGETSVNVLGIRGFGHHKHASGK